MKRGTEEARIKEIVAEMRRLDARREALSDELFDILDRLRRVSTETEQSTQVSTLPGVLGRTKRPAS